MDKLIAWSKEKGYYAKELTYGTNLSAPIIKIEDVKGWRQREIVNVNNQLLKKYKELEIEISKLIEDYNWNDLIYNHVEYSFIPVIGETYFLYKREDSTLFMSLIEPNQWDKKLVGSFTLDSSSKWKKND